MLIDHPNGNYTFIKGIGPFSSGCKAQPGYEIVHATFHPLPALQQGFELMTRHLQHLGRPIQAVCGMELRISQPLSPQAFNAFNAPYVQQLADWNIMVDGVNPVARTNVAIAVHPVAEPSLYGFSYTVPAQHRETTFVLSGSAETRRPQDGEGYEIVSHGDVSAEGLAQKASYVLQNLEDRLHEMEVTWADVTTVQLYTVHNIHPLLESTLLAPLGSGSQHGLQWHYSRPPVTELEYEMDARGVRQECVLAG
jgi:hypothetical protein